MRSLILITSFFFFSLCINAQPIPPLFFAQNAWMSDSLGNVDDCKGVEKGLNCKLWGKIHKDNTWEKIKQSGVKLIRFGGEHADENIPTRRQYIQIIDSARSKGIEPLLQVPYNNNYYTADTAAELVKYINVTMKRNVKYWSIGNEPDLSPPNGYGYFTASPIADYTKQFAVKMKGIDSTIITLGPELTYYDDRNSLITELTTPGGFYDITGRVPGHTYYYLDIITFHSYPFGGNQKREELISNLRDPWHISNMLYKLQGKLDSCNAFHNRGEHSLKIALTETSLNYKNSPDPELDAHSFIAGQFWAELIGVGMEKGLAFIAFWSVVESSLGYIDEKTGRFWPTYHHYKLAADNLKGTYYKSEISPGIKDLKSIVAADSNQISVILLNQKNKGKHHKYSLRIGNAKVQGKDGTNILIKDISSLKSTIVYNDSIEDESTSVLVFDYSGTLIKKINYKKSDGINAVPKLIKEAEKPVFVSIGPDIDAGLNEEIMLNSGSNFKKAIYKWYEGDSEIPMNESSANTIKIKATKDAVYKLVMNYDGMIIEDKVAVKIH
jgi:hypothetical protein